MMPLQGTARELRNFACFVSYKGIFDHAHDVLLLFTRQFACTLKNLSQFACRAASAWLFFDAKKCVNGDAEGLGEFWEVFGFEGDCGALPVGIAWLGDAE